MRAIRVPSHALASRAARCYQVCRERLASSAASTVWIGSSAATIRVAVGSDGPQVLALWRRAADESEFLVPCADELTTTDEQQSSALEKMLAAPNDLYLVVEVGAEIIGLGFLRGSTLRRFAHEVTLVIAVLSEWCGKGVGRALMRAMLDWADSRGMVRIALEVVETNSRAIALYESFGFEHEGRLRARRRHGDTYLDNHVMARVKLPS